MSEQTDNLISLLKPFGLSEEESKIYLTLLENGSLSALSISRVTHMARTKVYRLLDKLIEKQLVTQASHTSGFKFVANHPSKLEIILNQQQQSLVALSQSLPQVIKSIESVTGSARPSSQILYYQGPKGLSQVNWNLLNTKTEILSYEYGTGDNYLAYEDIEHLRQEMYQNRNISSRSFTNLKKIDPFTNVSNIVKLWQVRYLPKDLLNITFDAFIYNDIYTVCNFLDKGDIFCFEIKSQKIADFHRQTFDALWSTAKPLKFIGTRGQAKLV